MVKGKKGPSGKTKGPLERQPCLPQSPLARSQPRRSPKSGFPGPLLPPHFTSAQRRRWGSLESLSSDTCPAGRQVGRGELHQGFWKQGLTCSYTPCSLGSLGGDPWSRGPGQCSLAPEQSFQGLPCTGSQDSQRPEKGVQFSLKGSLSGDTCMLKEAQRERTMLIRKEYIRILDVRGGSHFSELLCVYARVSVSTCVDMYACMGAHVCACMCTGMCV